MKQTKSQKGLKMLDERKKFSRVTTVHPKKLTIYPKTEGLGWGYLLFVLGKQDV